VLAQKALSAVYRTGQRFGVGYVVDVLTGKSDERVSRNGHDRLSVFGIGQDLAAAEWRGLFRQLVAAGLLTSDDEGHGTLVLTENARPLLRGEQKFAMRKVAAAELTRKSKSGKKAGETAARIGAGDEALYQSLRQLRAKLAAEANVPPYVIFHDRTLAELAAKRPAGLADLNGITGLGERKIARYGTRLLECVTRFKKHPMLQNRLSATVNQTLALHLEGRDAEAIARERAIEPATVYGHFAEAIEAGLVEARQVVGLDESEMDEILAAFERLGTVDSGKLGPAHAALDGQYDWGILKCVLAEIA
jgi:ATP-dependent DNA helicase RecQ